MLDRANCAARAPGITIHIERQAHMVQHQEWIRPHKISNEYVLIRLGHEESMIFSVIPAVRTWAIV